MKELLRLLILRYETVLGEIKTMKDGEEIHSHCKNLYMHIGVCYFVDNTYRELYLNVKDEFDNFINSNLTYSTYFGLTVDSVYFDPELDKDLNNYYECFELRIRILKAAYES